MASTFTVLVIENELSGLCWILDGTFAFQFAEHTVRVQQNSRIVKLFFQFAKVPFPSVTSNPSLTTTQDTSTKKLHQMMYWLISYVSLLADYSTCMNNLEHIDEILEMALCRAWADHATRPPQGNDLEVIISAR